MAVPNSVTVPGPSDHQSESVYSFNSHNSNLEVNAKGVPRSVYDEVDPKTFLGSRGQERPLVNGQGLTLRTYYWPAEHPKAVLQFVHGHGAHGLFELMEVKELGRPPVYSGWLEKLNAAGISVVTHDNQGCGRSEAARGLRFYVESFQSYVDDVLLLRKELVKVDGFDNLPIFLGGISLGGCISLSAAVQEPSLYRGLLLLAPMISLQKVSRKGLNPYLRPVAALLSYVVPWAPIIATDRSKNSELQLQWDLDPLTSHMNTRVRNANEYLYATEQLASNLSKIAIPFIVFHSENDTMCDADGSRQLYEEAVSTDKTIKFVNNMWHVLVKEPGNEAVLETLIDWMDNRIPTEK